MCCISALCKKLRPSRECTRKIRDGQHFLEKWESPALHVAQRLPYFASPASIVQARIEVDKPDNMLPANSRCSLNNVPMYVTSAQHCIRVYRVLATDVVSAIKVNEHFRCYHIQYSDVMCRVAYRRNCLRCFTQKTRKQVKLAYSLRCWPG